MIHNQFAFIQNKQDQEKIEKMFEEMERRHKHNLSLLEAKLKEENKQLKQENEKWGLIFHDATEMIDESQLDKDTALDMMNELRLENKKLKEENNKLTDRLHNFKEKNWKRMDDLVKALSPWKKNHQDHTRILEAIGELKEENEKLKEEVELKKGAWCPELLFRDLFENTNYEPTHTIIQYIQMIEEENKKLKEEDDSSGDEGFDTVDENEE